MDGPTIAMKAPGYCSLLAHSHHLLAGRTPFGTANRYDKLHLRNASDTDTFAAAAAATAAATAGFLRLTSLLADIDIDRRRLGLHAPFVPKLRRQPRRRARLG